MTTTHSHDTIIEVDVCCPGAEGGLLPATDATALADVFKAL